MFALFPIPRETSRPGAENVGKCGNKLFGMGGRFYRGAYFNGSPGIYIYIYMRWVPRAPRPPPRMGHGSLLCVLLGLRPRPLCGCAWALLALILVMFACIFGAGLGLARAPSVVVGGPSWR